MGVMVMKLGRNESLDLVKRLSFYVLFKINRRNNFVPI